MFLTDAEIAELTGYKQPNKQVSMLRQQGVPFHINAAGHPKVARAVLERTPVSTTQPKTWTPSWAANPL
jgi:hypothetical protein